MFLGFAHLQKLFLDVALLSLTLQLIGLEFELVGQCLILASSFGPLLLPPLQTFFLAVEDFLVELVKLFSSVATVLLLLLLLQLFHQFLVGFELKISDHFVLHA